jgi:hypothetical protein
LANFIKEINMALQIVGQKVEYIALSTDTRPQLVPEKAGSIFTELDTGMKYVWSGTDWVEDLTLYNAVKMALEAAV